MNTKSNKKTVIILLVIVALIAIVPLFALKGADFGGSDDKGGEIIFAGTPDEILNCKKSKTGQFLRIANKE